MICLYSTELALVPCREFPVCAVASHQTAVQVDGEVQGAGHGALLWMLFTHMYMASHSTTLGLRLVLRMCRQFPARAVAARQSSEEQLAEAKVEAAELGTELAALKQELKKVRSCGLQGHLRMSLLSLAFSFSQVSAMTCSMCCWILSERMMCSSMMSVNIVQVRNNNGSTLASYSYVQR